MSGAMTVPWEPTEDDLHWTREQIDSLALDDVWDSGEIQYQRTGDTELTMITRTERALETHERVCVVLDAIGWTCVDDDPQITPDDPLAQLQQAQAAARGWQCPADDCDSLIANSDLDNVAWAEHEPLPMQGPDGDEVMVERWLVHVICHDCGNEIPMNPLDYGLLAGDDLFYTYTSSAHRYKVLSREAQIALIDSGGAGIPLGSTDLDGAPLPPHMQGTYCIISSPDSEEE